MSTSFLNYAKAHRGVAFNLVFILYVALFQPLLLSGASAVMHEQQINFLLGILLAGLLVVETIALKWKFRAVNDRQGKVSFEKNGAGGIFIIWIGHMLVVTILGMAMLQALGFDVASGAQSTLAGLIVFGLVIRELVLFLFYGASQSGESNKISSHKEFAADVMLTIFACVAYTATWEAIADTTGLSQYHGAELYLQAFVASLVFIILFVPTRFGFLYEELMPVGSERDTRAIILSTLITTAFVIGAMIL